MLCALAFCHTDAYLARQLLVWMGELGAMPRHELLLLASARVPKELLADMAQVAKVAFPKTTAIHQTQEYEPIPPWPRACNKLFQITAEWAKKSGKGAWLWLEPDAIPMSPGWLDAIESEYRRCGKQFMGTVYERPFKHLNGVMVYPPNISFYNRWMTGASDKPWDLTHPEATMRHGHNTHLIQRTLADPAEPDRVKQCLTFAIGSDLTRIRDGVVLFHGCKDGTLIERLRERRQRRALSTHADLGEIMIVWPFCEKDAGLAHKALGWMGELREHYDFDMLLSYDEKTGWIAKRRIMGMANRLFRTVSGTEYPSPRPTDWAPNVAFLHAANYMAKVGRPFLWLEPDVVPLVPGWMDRLVEAYRAADKPFAGPIIAGMGHMNGTGFYPSNTPEYIPRAMQVTGRPAWDMGMNLEMIDYCADIGTVFFHRWGEHEGKLHPFLNSAAPSFPKGSPLLDQIPESAAIFHRCKDGSLIERLRERKRAAVGARFMEARA